MTREEAEAKWAQMRDAITEVVGYDPVCTPEEIEREQNEIIKRILDVLFD